MSTIITHIFNEEYLLPWWLNHHKDLFEHGIIIDYNSTDNSIDIIKDICPNWDVIKSRNQHFDAHLVDQEVMDIEREIKGWKITLNTTEFILGDIKNLPPEPNQILIPSAVMVDSINHVNQYPDKNIPLIQQRVNGIYPNGKFFGYRRARSLHNISISYPVGRHFSECNTEDFLLLWYGFSPYNFYMIKRKLQIQNQIPIHNIQQGLGFHHITTKEKQDEILHQYQQDATNLEYYINKLHKPNSCIE
jgi:hypothetical protein